MTELEENQTIANALMILQRRNDELRHRAEIAEKQIEETFEMAPEQIKRDREVVIERNEKLVEENKSLREALEKEQAERKRLAGVLCNYIDDKWR